MNPQLYRHIDGWYVVRGRKLANISNGKEMYEITYVDTGQTVLINVNEFEQTVHTKGNKKRLYEKID